MPNITLELYRKAGQSLWLDGVERNLLNNGSLEALLGRGIRGVFGQLTPFARAVRETDAYDDTIRDLMQADHGVTGSTLHHWLVLQDVQMAADILNPAYQSSDGEDGYVATPLPPRLAYDTPGTIESARHLWRQAGRPNVMISVPATAEGLPAIEQLISDGINVNATLVFSPSGYAEAARAYLRGIERSPQTSAASTVSFCVAPIDAKVDMMLEALGSPEADELRGRAALSYAALTYERFKEIFRSPEFEALRQRGARKQRLVWCGTDPEGAEQSRLLYVDGLVASDTICAVSPSALTAFEQRAVLSPSLDSRLDSAHRHLHALESVGVDSPREVARRLERAVLGKLEQEHDDLVRLLDGKRSEVAKTFAE